MSNLSNTSCHIYFKIKYWELNLVRALDEDARVFFFSSLLFYWARQLFLGIPPPSSHSYIFICIMLHTYNTVSLLCLGTNYKCLNLSATVTPYIYVYTKLNQCHHSGICLPVYTFFSYEKALRVITLILFSFADEDIFVCLCMNRDPEILVISSSMNSFRKSCDD